MGRRLDISTQEEWGERVPRTQLIANGAASGIDAALLEETLWLVHLARNSAYVTLAIRHPQRLQRKHMAHATDNGQVDAD